jgi:hypothetical protein
MAMTGYSLIVTQEIGVLAAALDEYLDTRVDGLVEWEWREMPGAVKQERRICDLRQAELGGIGTIKLRIVSQGKVEIHIGDPPRPKLRAWTQEEKEAARSPERDTWYKNIAEQNRRIQAEADELYERRRRHFSALVDGWFEQMHLLGVLKLQPEEAAAPVPSGAQAETQMDRDALEEEKPRVPSRPKDRQRWQAIWLKVQAQWRQGKRYEQMSQWLNKMHPELNCSPDILADIIRAGEAGRLEEP